MFQRGDISILVPALFRKFWLYLPRRLYLLYKNNVYPYLEKRSLAYGGEFPSSLVPCLKSTAFTPLLPPPPSPPHPLPTNRTLIYIQTTLTCPLLLSGTLRKTNFQLNGSFPHPLLQLCQQPCFQVRRLYRRPLHLHSQQKLSWPLCRWRPFRQCLRHRH
jgi:hypothetical protein